MVAPRTLFRALSTAVTGFTAATFAAPRFPRAEPQKPVEYPFGCKSRDEFVTELKRREKENPDPNILMGWR
jgi:hypothetical protein